MTDDHLLSIKWGWVITEVSSHPHVEQAEEKEGEEDGVVLAAPGVAEWSGGRERQERHTSMSLYGNAS